MISGMHTNDGGEVVVCGHRMTGDTWSTNASMGLL